MNSNAHTDSAPIFHLYGEGSPRWTPPVRLYRSTGIELDDLGRPEPATPRPSRSKPPRDPDLFDTDQAAAYIGQSRRTLEKWRTQVDADGNVKGPKTANGGARPVLYHRAALDAFRASQTHLTAGQRRLKHQRRKPARTKAKPSAVGASRA